MSDSSDIGAFVVGFIVGGLVGAAAGLLLAPQSGEETRTLIVDSAEQAFEDARKAAEDAIEELRARSEELAELAKERVATMQPRAQTAPSVSEVVVEEVVVEEQEPPEVAG